MVIVPPNVQPYLMLWVVVYGMGRVFAPMFVGFCGLVLKRNMGKAVWATWVVATVLYWTFMYRELFSREELPGIEHRFLVRAGRLLKVVLEAVPSAEEAPKLGI